MTGLFAFTIRFSATLLFMMQPLEGKILLTVNPGFNVVCTLARPELDDAEVSTLVLVKRIVLVDDSLWHERGRRLHESPV